MRLTVVIIQLLRVLLCSLSLLVLSASAVQSGKPGLGITITTAIPATTTVDVAETTEITIVNNFSKVTILALNFITSVPTGSGTFTQTNTTCTGSLAPGASCTWTGSFTPTADGTNVAQIDVKYPGRDYPVLQTTQTTGDAGATQAVMWGNNANGQLGNGNTTTTGTPGKVITSSGGSPLTGVTQLVSGSEGDGGTSGFSCALLTNGQVQCWGSNGYGQLGNNSTTQSEYPVTVCNVGASNCDDDPLTNVTAISAGAWHVCALISNGTVDCWGYGGDGELGNNSTGQSHTPVAVCDELTDGCASALTGVTAITAGARHACAMIGTAGSARMDCWGDDGHGELGDNQQGGGTTSQDMPVAVCAALTSGDETCTPSEGELQDVSAIAAGGDAQDSMEHTCALLSSGKVDCWGSDNDGQLGDGDNRGSVTANQLSPVPVCEVAAGTGSDPQCNSSNQLQNVTAITAGGYNSCALISGGTMDCWGQEENGAIGDGDTATDFQLVPAVVCAVGASANSGPQCNSSNQLENVSAIMGGWDHVCALVDNSGTKEMDCWGNNADGELGQGDTGGSNTIPLVVSITGGAISGIMTKGLDENSGVIITPSSDASKVATKEAVKKPKKESNK